MGVPPSDGELELTIVGPGYGESIILHVGDGAWVIVDSSTDSDGVPWAFQYLRSMGLDPAKVIELIVASHWHDDHIRGIATLAKSCRKATFCCASALRQKEFLTIAHALEDHHFSETGSGMREIHDVFSHLAEEQSRLVFAIANRRIFAKGMCEIWALSPRDSNYIDFLRTIREQLPRQGQSKKRIPHVSPNRLSVVLWVKLGDIVVLLGSDLERLGWIEILEDVSRPSGKASVLKVAHHGSKNAHESRVWQQMLEDDPLAVLTPWQLGGNSLPCQQDVQRILSCTPNAFATAKPGSPARSRRGRGSMIRRTLRESGIELRRIKRSISAIRLRRPLSSGAEADWSIKEIGSACRLQDFFA